MFADAVEALGIVQRSADKAHGLVWETAHFDRFERKGGYVAMALLDAFEGRLEAGERGFQDLGTKQSELNSSATVISSR